MTPNTKRKKASIDYMELENIIEQMADAMRTANLKYIASAGLMTPGQEAAWDRYVIFAMKQTGKL